MKNFILKNCVEVIVPWSISPRLTTRPQRRRLMMILRMACRVLGLKRKRVSGLFGPARQGVAIAAGTALILTLSQPVGIAAGIFVNDSTDRGCTVVEDAGGAAATLKDINITSLHGDDRCDPGAKATQTDRVLFYGTQPTKSAITTSLTLGGELYVNGGFIGLNNQTTKSMAIGDGATQALGYGSIAFGNNARSTSQGNISIGRNAQTGYISTGPGLETDRNDTILESIAIGANAQAIELFSVALGRYAVTEDAMSFATALGAESRVKVAGGVALGAGSVSEAAVSAHDVTINSTKYVFAGVVDPADPAGPGGDAKGTAVPGTVSIGNTIQKRQLTNMAAGQINAASTDGVNGSQLFATNSALGTLGGRVNVNETKISKNTGDITNIINGKAGLVQQAGPGANITVAAGLDGAAIEFAGTTAGKQGPRKLINLSAGVDGTDAVNFSQLKAVDGRVATNTTNIANNTNAITNIDASVKGLKDDALQWDPALLSFSAKHGTGTTNKIANVTAGTDATDAVNVSQLKGLAEAGKKLDDVAVKYVWDDRNGNGELDAGEVVDYGKVKLTGAGTKGTLISNLGNGAVTKDSLEAVNGSQLWATSNSFATYLGGGAMIDANGVLTGPNYRITVINQDGTLISQDHDNVGDALGGLDNSVRIVNAKTENVTDRLDALGNDALIWDDSKKAFTASHTDTATRAVSGTTRITDLQAGTLNTNSTDAVNGSQLFDTNNRVTTNEGAITNLTNNVGDLTDRAVQYDGNKNDPKTLITLQGGTGGTTITNVKAAALGAASTEAVNGSQLYGATKSTATIFGGGADVDTDGTIKPPTYTIQTRDVHTVEDALEGLDTQVTTNTTNITSNTNEIKTINTSIGSLKDDALLWDPANGGAFSARHGATGLNKIVNVKAGEADTDAVNYGQLNGLANAGTEAVKKVGERAVKYAWFDTNKNGIWDEGEIVDLSRASLEGKRGTVIGNLAKGAVTETSTEAVNGSQLWATSNSFATFLGGGANIGVGGVLTGPTYEIANIGADGKSGVINKFDNVGAALGGLNSNITNVNDLVANLNTRFEASQLDALRWDENKKSFTAVHGGGGSSTGGGTKIAPVVNPLASGTNKITDLQVGEVSAVSTDAVNGSQLHETNQKVAALDQNAVKYKLNPDGTKTNEAALLGGDPDAPVLISNLEAGKADTDAVNVKQLKTETAKVTSEYLDQSKTYTNTMTANTLNQSTSYTDSKITNVNGRIDELAKGVNDGFARLSSDIGVARKEAYQGAAIGLAASSLRYDNTPGKLSVAMGGGVWRDQAAMAFGAGYTSESGKVRANVTGATSGGQVGVGAGISFTLN
ncbi:YadA-like family protein [Phyllobacterium bourgognense]|uniref:Autotransporter adhesin n=1 Tax=Phyllobacterium bourgognense TaxID=314236 RepID=A0A368YJ69_9HYPH|nr:YadA-like family protein [Phyllobacterium bourgognense]RCW79528.1 autotransporter adhesin [Phyllobacterium bourgognense]